VVDAIDDEAVRFCDRFGSIAGRTIPVACIGG
jgi:hypothetical protein